MRSLFGDENLNLHIRYRMAKCYNIHSVMLHGAEAWSMRERNGYRLLKCGSLEKRTGRK